ncbi:MAG TPA: peptidoglycan DD-metalloendopeptidase family protein [Anaerolineales bacterium]|nr:peptidoglycan DD-metalloendopeptidase family protein [Anaerolineales bacterium]
MNARPVVIHTEITPTNTFLPPTPSPSITPTLEPSCDPFSTDFCITEGHFILQRPIHPPAHDLVDPTYLYGSTADGTREPHHGVEFPNKSGTPVYAAGRGTVIFAGPDTAATYSPRVNFYGNLVVIAHADGLFTLYAHLSRVDVTAGQQVLVGDQIGEVGLTGVAIGSHLHFEVRQGDVQDYFATQNPELWLAPETGTDGNLLGTLMISVVDQDHRLVSYAAYTIRYYPDQKKKPVKSYYGETYSPDMLRGAENAVLGELPPGHYRIAVEGNGKVYERRVEVESGKLTQVVFVVK